MKIGIYGGSFNPIHKKHVNVINELLDKYLDKIIIVPAGDKYSKSSLISARDRINMIELAIKPDKRKIVDNYECTNERRYTYETLNHMKKLYPDDEIYFVMGLDNLDWFDEWKEYEYMLDNYKFLIIKRDGFKFDEVMKKYEKWKDNITLTNLPEDNISSTFIRENINNKEKIKGLIDDKVYEYIKENELYIK